MAKKKRISKAQIQPSENQLPGATATRAGCTQVWTGTIARLRIYDQPGSTGKKVFAYKAPGGNVNYVGYSDDPNVIHALFLARDSGQSITGYTNSTCRIEWLDY
jgi:hypothetical protein